MREADAGFCCGTSDPVAHLRRIGIWLTFGIQVQIVKFTNGRVASLQHFYVELGSDGLIIFRREICDEAVHNSAPGPEAVVCAGARNAPLRQPDGGTLESVAVQVRHAGHYNAANAIGVSDVGI